MWQLTMYCAIATQARPTRCHIAILWCFGRPNFGGYIYIHYVAPP